jgi:hypothetical protein
MFGVAAVYLAAALPAHALLLRCPPDSVKARARSSRAPDRLAGTMMMRTMMNRSVVEFSRAVAGDRRGERCLRDFGKMGASDERRV